MQTMTTNSLDRLKDQIRNCCKCVNLYRSRVQAVPGDGSQGAEILIVGLAPGRNGADITGIPFTKDKAGTLLRQMIGMINISSQRIYITNVVKCNPKDSKGRNRKPTQKEIDNCFRHLEEEIELVSPKIIVTLGVKATEVVVGKKIDSLKRYNCRVMEIERKHVFPMFHPGFVVRGAYDRKNYENDFRILKSVIDT